MAITIDNNSTDLKSPAIIGKQNEIINLLTTTNENVSSLLTITDGSLPAIRSTIRKASVEVVTTTDAAVTAIIADAVNNIYHVKFANEGAVAGWYSIDGGTTWGRLPSESMFILDGVLVANEAIQVKRIAGGSNLSGVYVEAW